MKNKLMELIELLKEQRDEEKLQNINFYKKYFLDFFKKYPARDFIKMCEIEYEELLFSLVLIDNPENSIQCYNMLVKHKDVIFSGDVFLKLPLLLNYLQNDVFERLILDVKGKNLIKRKKAWKSLSNICKNIGCKEKDINELIIFLEKHSIVVEDLKPFLIKIMPNMWEACYKFYDSLIAFKYFYEHINNKKSEVNKLIKSMIKYNDDATMVVLKYSDYLYDTFMQVLKDIDKEIKRINAKNKALNELIKLLNIDGEITNIDYILELCPNDEIKILIVDYIVENNRQYNLQLLKDYEAYKFNSDVNLTRLFSLYGYSYDIYSVLEKDVIKLKSYDKLENIFKKLKANQIKLHETDLLYLDEEILDKIIYYLNLGIFKSNFVIENILVLIDSFALVESNIELLLNKGINLINYSTLEILFNKDLDKQISIIESYELSIKRETSNIGFLSDYSNILIEKIDFVIEAGYYEQLNESLDILNYSIDDLKNLKIKEQLNLSKDGLIDLNGLFLQDNFIDDTYIEVLKSSNNYIQQLPDFLLNCKLNDYVLLINGVFVSIPRLIRNLAKFENLDENIIWSCILYGGSYTLEEIEKIGEYLFKKDDVLYLIRK